MEQKTCLSERTTNQANVYNEKWSKTLHADFVIGAAASFPQDTESPFS